MPDNINNRRIEYMAVSELMTRLHPMNPKEHDIPMIAQSFVAHGFVSSGTIDERTGLFLCGHGRTHALQHMIDQQMDAPRDIDVRDDDWYCPVECGYQSLNDAQALAYIAIDNQATIAGDWNKAKLASLLTAVKNSDETELTSSGFDEQQLKEIMTELANQQEPPEEGEVPIDRAAELNEKWQVKLGDIWEIPSASGTGTHRIMCGDSTSQENVEQLMNGMKAECVVTDPPYGVNYADKNKFLNAISPGNRIQTPIKNDHGDKRDIQDIWKNAFCEMEKIMASGAVVYCFMPQGGDQMMMMMMMMGAGIEPRHELIWVKNNHVLGRVDYAYKHEPILYAWKDGGHKFYGDFQTSILEFPKPQKSDLHPTTKPFELIARLITNSSLIDDIIYDPFLGSGTTIVAAEQTGRIGYGMELHPPYVAVSLERLSALGLSPVRVNP